MQEKIQKTREQLDKKGSKQLLNNLGKKQTKWTRNCARKLPTNLKSKVRKNHATMYARREGPAINNTCSTEVGTNVCTKRSTESRYAGKVAMY